jgi:hypothetical protein
MKTKVIWLVTMTSKGAIMAEGGGIGPRSSKGTAVYKTASVAKQTPSGQAKRTITTALVGASSKKSRLGPSCYRPDSTVNLGWNQAIAILGILILQKLTAPCIPEQEHCVAFLSTDRAAPSAIPYPE